MGASLKMRIERVEQAQRAREQREDGGMSGLIIMTPGMTAKELEGVTAELIARGAKGFVILPEQDPDA